MQLRQSVIHNVTCDENVVIYEPVNLYNCMLGDNVFVGLFARIQGNMQIGVDSKIQSHTFICEYVTLDAYCSIGHSVMLVNDMLREGKLSADRSSWGRTSIGNGVSTDSGTAILAVTICDGTVIDAGIVVTKSITERGVHTGNPVKLLRHL